MSRLEDLIQTLCPDGVGYQKLGDICQIATGKLNVNKQSDNGKYPFFTCAKEVYRIDIFAFDTEALLISGNGNVGYIHYYNGKFNAYQRTYVLSNFSINIFFVKHVLEWGLKKRIAEGLRLGSVPYIRLETLRDFFIPLPPLPVQEEIVRILDTFSGVVTELEAEQAARVRQYEHYRNELLSFDSKSRWIEKLLADCAHNGMEYVELAELAEIGTGNSNRVDANVEGKYPFFVRSKQVMRSNKYDFDEEAIVIPGEGGIGEIFHYVHGKYDLHQRAYRISFRDSSVNTRFAYYFMVSNFKRYITMKAVTATVISIRMPMISSFLLPLPPLEVQEQIVTMLDRFDTLVNDLKSGLPAEIALRRKQYEYYRDKLLTFPAKQPPL